MKINVLGRFALPLLLLTAPLSAYSQTVSADPAPANVPEKPAFDGRDSINRVAVLCFAEGVPDVYMVRYYFTHDGHPDAYSIVLDHQAWGVGWSGEAKRGVTFGKQTFWFLFHSASHQPPVEEIKPGEYNVVVSNSLPVGDCAQLPRN
jgi:hypothetical protein